MDIGPKFLDDKGFLSEEMMPDTTHPSEKGHQIWADAVVPKLKELMGNKRPAWPSAIVPHPILK